MDLRDHQLKARDELRNGSILWGGVGSGKSRTAVAYYLKEEMPRDIYVITTAKKRDSLDWVGEFAAVAIGRTVDSTIGGVLRVDSWNNIGKYEGVKGAFFIFDEQRLVGSGTWVKAFLKIARSNRWILLSATPGDTWLDYIPVFIANGFYKNRTEFLREHVVYSSYAKFPKVERYVGTRRLVSQRNRLLVEMPYDRHTIRSIEDIRVKFDKERYQEVLKKRWQIFENRPLKNVAELFQTVRKVAYSDPSRVEAIRELLRRHPKLIVFYNFDYELELLRAISLEVQEIDSSTTSTCQSPSSSQKSSSNHSSDHLTTLNGCGSELVTKERGDSWTSTTNTSSNSPKNSSSNFDTSQRTPTEETSSSCERTLSTPWRHSSLVVAEWNGHKHEPIPNTDHWLYLVQYAAGAEGWNCVETDAMAFYSLTYSYKLWEQAFGRIDRLNTPFKELHYYPLMSKAGIDLAVRQALADKRDFNESKFYQSSSRRTVKL